MPTLSQTGAFYVGTVGFPIRFTLLDGSSPRQPLIPGTVALNEIVSFELTIIRPDQSTIFRPLGYPAAFVNGAVEYVFVDGDLTAGGHYDYVLVLILTNSRRLPVMGSFNVLY